MNKAYILVHRERYEGDTIYGVYSTLENAQQAHIRLSSVDHYLTPMDSYLVLEVGVDQEPDFDSAEVVA